MAIPKKVADRLSAGLKRFKPVLESAKARDVNESDTSMIVTDMLADVFGLAPTAISPRRSTASSRR